MAVRKDSNRKAVSAGGGKQPFEAEATDKPVRLSSQELKERIPEILENIEGGAGLGKALEGKGMPGRTLFYKWLDEDADLANKYAHACARRADRLVEEIIEIADDSSEDWKYDDKGNKVPDGEAVQRSRLRVDARKWAASKLAPKKYGDKLELAGDPERPVELTIIRRELKSRADLKNAGT